MKERHWLSWNWLGRKLRGHFLAGLVVLVPLGVTVWILVWIFTTVDDLLRPIIEFSPILRQPGVGFGITIVLIYLVGVIASNVIGRRLIHFSESLVARVPIVRPLYTGIKQLLESFYSPTGANLMQAVLIEFPRKGIWTIGFITHESQSKSGEKRLNIFIPTAPNPTSGFLQIVGEEEIIRTDIPVEEALKMVISAGRVSPQEIAEHLSGRTG